MIRCMIIDGDENARNHLAKIIDDIDHLKIVKSCNSVSQALPALANDKIDLIFIDLLIPGVDGMGFLNAITDKRPQVIVTTGKKEVAVKAFEIEASDFILKPVTQKRLLKAIAKTFHLNNHATNKEKENENS